MLVMILPISVYLTRTRGRRWIIASVFLLVGAMATGSRTALSMILAEFILFLIVKPRETKRLLPLLRSRDRRCPRAGTGCTWWLEVGALSEGRLDRSSRLNSRSMPTHSSPAVAFARSGQW